MYFHYHTDERHLDAPLVSSRCKYTKNNHEQCKNKVVIGKNYCYVHRLYELHLQIKKSTIPNAGIGLFAIDKSKGNGEVVFKKSQKICDYNGEVISLNRLNARYGDTTAPYAIALNKNKYEDGAINRGIGTVVNHSSNKSKVNCRFSIKRDNTAEIIATKNIKNGAELFVDYGDDYKLNEVGVFSSTNKKKKDYSYWY